MRRSIASLLLTAPLLAAPSPVGAWAGQIALPGMALKIEVTLEQRGAIWLGRVSIPAQGAKDLPLGDVKVEGERVSFSLPGIPGDPRFVGRLTPGHLDGDFTQGGQRFPFTLTPASAPAAPTAPAPPPVAAQDRELGFPGFGAFPLKASVRAAQGHPYFAVMVAGSGPTDRNWSNPLIPMPSHGGRDVAAWLQAQGIGSLRYDKRFIGAKDPKLDISLDAQVGDIKAAMAAARALPEAKGKKLLLVGHSEGALLSLLAAGEADAALLLALPGISMGKLIVAQLKGQLDVAGAPADMKAANLAYLEQALDAARLGKDLPDAGILVAQGVVTLAKGLTRPESRAFVGATLDLDPWGMAQRLPIPWAVVWGDRDIQTWKPEVLPADLKGKVIEIPQANHLLKRESRDRASLLGPYAMTAYGDDTPLADLAPLAAWLKTLK